jgi:hypothetical protein
MVNRRLFAKQIVGYLPVAAMAAQTQQAAPQAPAGGRGTGAPGGMMGGRGQRTGPPDPFAGSPVGSPLPGQKWLVHDHSRTQPRKVTPGAPLNTVSAPSDAIVLFNGKDLSKWSAVGFGGRGGGRGMTPGQAPQAGQAAPQAPPPAAPASTEAQWPVVDGHMEMAGGIATKESFGDIQLHMEWLTPPIDDPDRVGQQRGNSGVIFMGRYEVQLLSGFNNITYADGMAGAMYGVYPPMVNPCLPEGQWNSLDFVFEAPKFEGENLTKPAFLTLFFNGIVVHHRAQFLGTTTREPLAAYTPHAAELPLQLQGHAGPAWFRNVWIRRVPGYDAA